MRLYSDTSPRSIVVGRNEYIGKLIGTSLGKVEEVEVDNDEVIWGKFMRIRVKMDISEPLVRGKKLKVGETRNVFGLTETV